MNQFIIQQSYLALESYAIASIFAFVAMFGTCLAVLLIFLLIEKILYKKNKD